MNSLRFGPVVVSRLFVITASLIAGLATGRPATAENPPAAEGGHTFAGPYTHDNLVVYLIRGADAQPVRHFLTLQEGLAEKVITVYETGSVNQLLIENTSSDVEVYVQSGDIVKGGQQDRTIALDFICPPRTKLPIAAFCVEAGRWHGRGSEPTTRFSSSANQISGNALKVAAKGAADQGEVWRQVDVLQRKASGNTGGSVNSAESSTSLQLSLENKGLTEMTSAYVKALATVVDRTPDAVGCAFAVNGKVRSIDLYPSHELFAKLWPKLLGSSAVEAVADLQKGKTFETPLPSAIAACIEGAATGKATNRRVTDRVSMVTRETEGNLVYETRDQAGAPAETPAATATSDASWIHRSYLVKDEETRAALRAAATTSRSRNAADPSVRQQPTGNVREGR